MEQKDDEPPPFWLQSTTTLRQVDRHRRRNRQASSLLLNTGVLVIFLLLAAFLFLVIAIPYILSLAKQAFNPSLVKTGWSSLNIVLVLFAILCGFLSRNQDDPTTPATTPTAKNLYKPEPNPTHHWYDTSFGNNNVENVTRLRRNSSSYPDLRQDSAWIVKENNNLRFYDDTDVESYQFQRSDARVTQISRSFRKLDDYDGNVEDQVNVKHIQVDEQEVLNELPSKDLSPSPSVVDEDESGLNSGSEAEKFVDVGNDDNVVDDDGSSSVGKDVEVGSIADIADQDRPTQAYIPPPSPSSYFWPSPSPPPPPPPPPTRREQSSTPAKETSQTFETIGYGRYKWNDSRVTEPRLEVQQPPQETPPSPPPARSQDRDKKRGGVTVTKDFFTSFYHQSKRKRKHKRRSYDTLEEFIEPSTMATISRSKSTPEFPLMSPPPPPTPPPPPPPISVFHNLFTKKGKTKTTKSKPKIPPHPKKSVKKIVSFSITTDDENATAAKGNESPMIPIPPPPPPPPFKMKPWRFINQGDYVKIESNIDSPRSGYSASEDESISPNSAQASQTSTPTKSLFCPSPDVNMKADDFIAKFRAKLTLEKSDSINLKQGTGTGPSRLRPDSN